MGWALYFLIFFSPVLILYLTRRRRRTLVSSLLLWKMAAGPQASARPRRLREILALLLHAGFLLCLSLALDQGRSESSAHESSAYQILLVETGGEAGRLYGEEAVVRLRELKQQIQSVLGLSAGSRSFLLMEYAGAPRLLTPFLTDQRQLALALDQLHWQQTPARLREALELALILLSTHPRGEVTLLSTGYVAESDATYLEAHAAVRPGGAVHLRLSDREIPLRWIPIERKKGKAITGFFARRDLQNPNLAEVVVEIRNWNNRIEAGSLRLFSEGSRIHDEPVSMKPGELFRVTYRLTVNKGRRLSCQLEDPRSGRVLSLAFSSLPESTTRVVLVTTGNKYLEGALRADHRFEVKVVSPHLYEPLDQANLFIFDRAVPENAPAAPAIFIAPPRSLSPVPVVGQTSDIPALYWEEGDPVWNPISPLGWEIRESLCFSPQDSYPLLWSGDKNVMAFFSNHRGRGIVIGWDMASSNLTHHPSFPVWFANLISSVRTLPIESFGASTGMISFRQPLPFDANWKVKDPQDQDVPSWRDDSRIQLHAAQAGFYTAVAPGRAEGQPFALNRWGSAERDVRELGWTPEMESLASRLQPPRHSFPRWAVLLMAAVTISALELALYRWGVAA